MRFHVPFAFLVATATFSPSPAPAAVFERDFVPGSGDGLLTYDDVNQREWLDVTVFAGEWSGNHTMELASRDPGFDFTVEFPELTSGGLYDSFMLAESTDVIALAESAGIDTTVFPSPSNVPATSELIELLGVTLNNPADATLITAGFLDDFQNGRLIAEFYLSTMAGLFISSGGSGVVMRSDIMGLMLHRDAIPEPSSLTLLMACWFGGCGAIPWRLRVLYGRAEYTLHPFA